MSGYSGGQQRGRELHYRADLDGLRGIAILAVLGFHAFPEYFPGGFVGVDVFFVLSGYLITGIILQQLHGSAFSLATFYLRRARRLLPALLVVLASCLVFGWFALLPDEFKDLGKHVGAAAAFVLNFSVWREGGYFDTAATANPMLHLWSLGIEEQFYLIWPLVMLLLWRYPRILLGTVGVLVLASFILNVYFIHADPRGDFFLPVTRFWELGLGCLLAVLGSYGRAPALQGCDRVLSVLGVALIIGAVFLFDGRVPFPGWAALLPVAGAVCVIGAGPQDRFRQRVLAAPGLVFVGLISYPLYLWHWPLLSFAAILGSGTVPAGVRAASVLLSFILAYLVFRLVEHPIRTRRASRTGGLLVAGLGAMGVAGFTIFSAAGIRSRFGPDVQALQPPSKINHTCLEAFPDKGNFNYCKSTFEVAPAVMFLGDSRTQALYDGVVSLSKRRYPMMLLARGGCPPLLNAHVAESERKANSSNATWWDFVNAVRLFRPRVVVLSGGGAGFFSPDRRPVVDVEFEQGLGELVRTLQETSTVIYVREIPTFDTGPSCFLRPVRVPWDSCAPVVPRAAIERRLADYNHAVDEVGARLPGLVVVDSIQALCGSKYSAQKLGSGEILYRDPLHLTPAGARRLDWISGLFSVLAGLLQHGRVDSCVPHRQCS